MPICFQSKINNLKAIINFIFLFCINLNSVFCQKSNFCKGDFQSYILSNTALAVDGKFELYQKISNDTSCWYSQTLPNRTIQIKTFVLNGVTTNVLDFIIKSPPYIPCQNLTLQINSKYQLQFDFLLDLFQQSASISVLINNAVIYSATSNNNAAPLHNNFSFIANTSINQICFNNTKVIKNSYSSAVLLVSPNNFGPMLDNVNLQFISNLTPNITNNTNIINITNNNTLHSLNSTNTTNISNITNISNNLTNFNDTNNNIQNLNTTNINYSINLNNATYQNFVFNNSNSVQIPKNSELQKYIVNFLTQWNPYKGTLLFISTFQPSVKGISLQIFQYCHIQINGQLIQNPLYKQDQNGYLYVQTKPQIVYSTQILNNVKVYIDHNLMAIFMNGIYIFTVNGNQVQMDVLNYDQKKLVAKLQPFVEKMSQVIRQTFTVMNLLYCSYFIMNLIQFWNLTLLYNFLMIKSLPKFAQAILSRMINFYFTYNSFSIQINKMLHRTQQNLFNFSNLSQLQKVSKTKDGNVWFGFLGGSSNFMVNNLDSLLMMVFFLVKVSVFMFIKKIIVYFFPKLQQIKFNLSLKSFPNQILCFSPFFLVSSFQVFLYLGQMTTLGKLNNIFHIFFTYVIIFLSFLKLIKFENNDKHNKKQKQQILTRTIINSIKKKNKTKYQQLIQILMNLLIPTLVVIGNQISFFILISMIIILKLTAFFKSKYKCNFFEKSLRIFSNINWLLYHFSFLSFYVIDYLVLKNVVISNNLIKSLGFIVISGILLGGMLDILQFIIKLLLMIFRCLKYLYKKFIVTRKDKGKLNLTNQQKDKQFSIQNMLKSSISEQKTFVRQKTTKVIHFKNQNDINSNNNSQILIPIQQLNTPNKTQKKIKSYQKCYRKTQNFEKSQRKQILVKSNRVTIGECQ